MRWPMLLGAGLLAVTLGAAAPANPVVATDAPPSASNGGSIVCDYCTTVVYNPQTEQEHYDHYMGDGPNIFVCNGDPANCHTGLVSGACTEAHCPCPECGIGGDPDPAVFSGEVLSAALRSAQAGRSSELRALLTRFPDRLRVNRERHVLQVLDCIAHTYVVAQAPLTGEAVALE